MSDRLLLVYDGDCAFCSSCERWIARRVPVTTVPYQRADLAALGLSTADAEQSIWVFDGDDVTSGADAAAALLRHADTGGWRVAGRVLALPGIRSAARPAYRLVARNRHRMPGGTPACRLPE
ncbi:MAG: DUF393 domain-containing protein [Gordonia sp. (in: high G+C Gram-positive bacteria)]|uniref:thiol-disulfide oxidoreductase DCC family protein n=1 Tax=Gordonia sp. (in: high G+C Gram-positive bacteria) TaxID=84139 RepID=UPI0039E4E5C4